MKLTIVVSDGVVIKNGMGSTGLDLSSCGIPADIHAVQWGGRSGHIELSDASNITITELPQWALNAVQVHEEELLKPAKTPSFEEQAEAMRAYRDFLLLKSDWTQLPDVPEATRLAFVPYRQTLRDITTRDGFPFSVVFPDPPQ